MKRIFQIIILLIVLIPQLGVKASFETAESICLLNSITGEVVYEKNFKEKKSMASTTKIMTLITALENSKLDDTVTVCKEAPLAEGSSAYIKADAKISMRDLLYGLMLNSGNDAAIAVACHISGDTKHFADLMNDTAKKIGVRNSHFKNPNGLEEEGHYTAAYDLAVMFSVVAHVADPDIFVLGGGVMKGKDVFFDKMEAYFRSMIHTGMQSIEFKEVELAEPGIVGAAMLVKAYN